MSDQPFRKELGGRPSPLTRPLAFCKVASRPPSSPGAALHKPALALSPRLPGRPRAALLPEPAPQPDTALSSRSSRFPRGVDGDDVARNAPGAQSDSAREEHQRRQQQREARRLRDGDGRSANTGTGRTAAASPEPNGRPPGPSYSSGSGERAGDAHPHPCATPSLNPTQYAAMAKHRRKVTVPSSVIADSQTSMWPPKPSADHDAASSIGSFQTSGRIS
jgi:hypothetical protein